MARQLVISDVIRKSETVTLTVGDKTASKTVYLEEPVSVYLDVQDAPYNQSVARCGGHVNNLRNSVIACNLAEVAAKETSATKIGKHISSGFLNYIAVNLDIQNMEEFSNLEALASELHMQSDALLDKKNVMTSDYEILTTRYSSVFQNLDKELANRIRLLLEPCFKFVQSSQKEQCRNATSSLLAMALVGQKEQSNLQAKLCATRMKQRASELIKSAKNYLLGQKKLEADIEQTLTPEKQSGTRSLPVIFFEIAAEKGGRLMQVIMNPETRSMGVNEQKVRQNVLDGTVGMNTMPSDSQRQINTHLDKLISSLGTSEHDKRVAQTIRNMHKNFAPQTAAYNS